MKQALTRIFCCLVVGIVALVIYNTGVLYPVRGSWMHRYVRTRDKSHPHEIAIFVHNKWRRNWFRFGGSGFWPTRLTGKEMEGIQSAFSNLPPDAEVFEMYLETAYPLISVSAPIILDNEVTWGDALKLSLAILGTIIGLMLLIIARRQKFQKYSRSIQIMNITLGAALAGFFSLIISWFQTLYLYGRGLIRVEIMDLFGSAYIIAAVVIGILICLAKLMRLHQANRHA